MVESLLSWWNGSPAAQPAGEDQPPVDGPIDDPSQGDRLKALFAETVDVPESPQSPPSLMPEADPEHLPDFLRSGSQGDLGDSPLAPAPRVVQPAPNVHGIPYVQWFVQYIQAEWDGGDGLNRLAARVVALLGRALLWVQEMLPGDHQVPAPINLPPLAEPPPVQEPAVPPAFVDPALADPYMPLIERAISRMILGDNKEDLPVDQQELVDHVCQIARPYVARHLVAHPPQVPDLGNAISAQMSRDKTIIAKLVRSSLDAGALDPLVEEFERAGGALFARATRDTFGPVQERVVRRLAGAYFNGFRRQGRPYKGALQVMDELTKAGRHLDEETIRAQFTENQILSGALVGEHLGTRARERHALLYWNRFFEKRFEAVLGPDNPYASIFVGVMTMVVMESTAAALDRDRVDGYFAKIDDVIKRLGQKSAEPQLERPVHPHLTAGSQALLRPIGQGFTKYACNNEHLMGYWAQESIVGGINGAFSLFFGPDGALDARHMLNPILKDMHSPVEPAHPVEEEPLSRTMMSHVAERGMNWANVSPGLERLKVWFKGPLFGQNMVYLAVEEMAKELWPLDTD